VLVAGDISDAARCRFIIGRAIDESGGVDILNNAAHQATLKDVGEISDAE
jgi:NAD(P)-dependent dehydrogenase (short-subunit alcohol dehydrogenase family)